MPFHCNACTVHQCAFETDMTASSSCHGEALVDWWGRVCVCVCVCVCMVQWFVQSISSRNIAGSIPAEYGFTRLSSPSLSLGGYQQPKCVCENVKLATAPSVHALGWGT